MYNVEAGNIIGTEVKIGNKLAETQKLENI